ncbi:acetyl-CoA carboxylase biotin carboxyl carrier protein [Proteinivorax hydrogeniformans]|uniref:Biotin carboxyl carrier protein of acetyl-CoA carboxylase n=1 Tax=Proteinivorax hydrogeniformans TaxID=1826727 RepID=A0AAU8HVK3_9FIRM
MNIKEITELIKVMNKSNLTKLEIQENAVSIKMEKQGERVMVKEAQVVEPEEPVNTQEIDREEPTVKKKEQPKVETKVNDENTVTITSPIVGTFYESPAPGKPPYVKVGSKVAVGDTLCIVEAMKIMNEIDSEVCGEVVEVMVNDGDMVEFGQELFKIAKR